MKTKGIETTTFTLVNPFFRLADAAKLPRLDSPR